MKRVVLRDDQWERIKDLLPGKASDCGVTASESIIYRSRAMDCQNRFTLARFDNRGSHKGTWAYILAAVSDDPDLEYLMVVGSIVRVHQHGAAKKQQQAGDVPITWRLEHQDPCVIDTLGNPVRLLLTAGQTSEYTQAEALIAGFEAGYVLADKGYDSDAFSPP